MTTIAYAERVEAFERFWDTRGQVRPLDRGNEAEWDRLTVAWFRWVVEGLDEARRTDVNMERTARI